MHIYKFLFFTTLGEFVKAKSSKQNQIKNVIESESEVAQSCQTLRSHGL